MTDRYSRYRKARDRALSRLANAYPNQYKQYLQEERANELNKDSGAGDDGGTTSLVGARTGGTTTRPQAADGGENEGDRGGEA
jgi:hypothetical protein